MKAKDIISQEELDLISTCDVCQLHEKAYEIIPNGITCPECGEVIPSIDFYSNSVEVVVGGTNAYEPDEDMYKMMKCNCTECNSIIGLLPIKLRYNGNHDIYYTGADYYLDKDIDFNHEQIDWLINNFIERKQAGEDGLKTSHLRLWIEREIKHNVAKYLFDRGLKFIIKEDKI